MHIGRQMERECVCERIYICIYLWMNVCVCVSLSSLLNFSHRLSFLHSFFTSNT